MTAMTSDIWSCNPADIPPWTEDQEMKLNAALAKVFGWADSVVEEANREVQRKYQAE